MKVKEIKMREDAQMTQPATVTKFVPGQELAVSNPQTGTTVTTDLRKNPAALSIDPATGKPLVDPTPTAGTAAANTNPASQLRPGASAELAVGEEASGSSPAALLMKLAKVVKSVRTPEQYAAAKKYAKMAHEKLIAPHYGSFLPKDSKAMDDILAAIESDLATKRRELGLPRPHRDNFEFDEAHGPIGGDATDDFINDIEDKDFRESTDLDIIKKLSGL